VKPAFVELAERIESNTDFNPTLAKELFKALRPEQVPDTSTQHGYGWREDSRGWWLQTGSDQRTPPARIDPPRWLESVDEALRLIPSGWEYSLYRPTDGSDKCEVQLETPDIRADYYAEPVSGTSHLLARAICAAALRVMVRIQ
jgi:hypothetical protein